MGWCYIWLVVGGSASFIWRDAVVDWIGPIRPGGALVEKLQDNNGCITQPQRRDATLCNLVWSTMNASLSPRGEELHCVTWCQACQEDIISTFRFILKGGMQEFWSNHFGAKTSRYNRFTQLRLDGQSHDLHLFLDSIFRLKTFDFFEFSIFDTPYHVGHNSQDFGSCVPPLYSVAVGWPISRFTSIFIFYF